MSYCQCFYGITRIWNHKKQCIRKGIGESCDYTHNCESNACRNGKCIVPLENNSSCESDWHCSSGNCFDWKCQNKRDLLQSCDRSKQCIAGADCLNYLGTRGICKYHWNSRDINDRCTEDYECKEGTCIGGTCQMKQLGDDCKSHKQLTKQNIRIEKLILSNYRNHKFLELNLTKDIILICGKNGSGKTNILESISLFTSRNGLKKTNLTEIVNSKLNGPLELFGVNLQCSVKNKRTKIGFGLKKTANGLKKIINLEGLKIKKKNWWIF